LTTSKHCSDSISLDQGCIGQCIITAHLVNSHISYSSQTKNYCHTQWWSDWNKKKFERTLYIYWSKIGFQKLSGF